MSTPGRRRALRALARRKKLNVDRVAMGEPPLVAGKPVAGSKLHLTKAKAKRIMKARSIS